MTTDTTTATVPANSIATPTGLASLDKVFGIGGMPKGRIIEMFGPESSGKTALALTIIAEAQRQGLVCAFVDVGNDLDLKQARDMGVNCSHLLLSQPEDASQAQDVIEALVRSGQVGVVVADDIQGGGPTGDMEDPEDVMRRIATLCIQTGTTLIVTGQAVDVEVGPSQAKAVKFYASTRLRLVPDRATRGQPMTFEVQVVKNKMAPSCLRTKLAATAAGVIELPGTPT